MLKQVILPSMPANRRASIDETDQRCFVVGIGATAAGAVACFDTSPARLAALVGAGSRRALQNDSTASATAALISD